MNQSNNQAVGKGQPSIGSGCPSLPAIGPGTKERKPMPMAFEQQPRESNKAFAAFKTYLEQGAQRSLASVGAKLGKSKTMMEKWSRKFDWQARVAAYAAHLAEAERLAIERMATDKAVEWWKLHEPTRRQAWLEAERA